MKSAEANRPIDLSIIVPAFQEAAVITSSLVTLATWLDSHDYGVVEVLVVVAESADATAELVRNEAHRFTSLRLLEPGKRVGKGRDVRYGMLGARGQYRLFMDADLATPLSHLDDVKALIAAHGDMAIAVRDLPKIHHTFKRRVLTEAGNLLVQLVLLPGIKDSQCGFKVFRADVAEAVFTRQTIVGWGFDLEILALARLMHYKIVTFDAPDWADPKAASFGLVGDSTRGAAIQTLKDLWKVRLNILRRRYNVPTRSKPA